VCPQAAGFIGGECVSADVLIGFGGGRGDVEFFLEGVGEDGGGVGEGELVVAEGEGVSERVRVEVLEPPGWRL